MDREKVQYEAWCRYRGEYDEWFRDEVLVDGELNDDNDFVANRSFLVYIMKEAESGNHKRYHYQLRKVKYTVNNCFIMSGAEQRTSFEREYERDYDV
jgi:hypothetical protein